MLIPTFYARILCVLHLVGAMQHLWSFNRPVRAYVTITWSCKWFLGICITLFYLSCLLQLSICITLFYLSCLLQLSNPM